MAPSTDMRLTRTRRRPTRARRDGWVGRSQRSPVPQGWGSAKSAAVGEDGRSGGSRVALVSMQRAGHRVEA